MNNTVKTIIAIIAGIVVGGTVNMMLVSIGPSVIPLPPGADVSTTEGLSESMKLFTPANFVFPFLAHALGTLVGAWVAARFAADNPMRSALIIGVFFLLGGIYAVYLFGGPLWFKATDLLLAYIPMAYLGGKLSGKTNS